VSNELRWLWHVMFCPLIGYVPIDPRVITDPQSLTLAKCRTCGWTTYAASYELEYDARKEINAEK
jgi:hypothetical protein